MKAAIADFAVVGAGPAGIAAVAEARRQGCRTVLLFDPAGRSGGTIRLAQAVRNVPFLPDFVCGERVASELDAYRCRLGVEVTPVRVQSIVESAESVVVHDEKGRVWHCRNLVIATGTRARIPEVPGLPSGFEAPWAASAEEAWQGDSPVSAAVLGAGDVAFDQACWLSARGARVFLLCRAARPRAPEWLQHRATEAGVEVLLSCSHLRADSERGVVRLSVEQPGQHRNLAVQRIVAAVGRLPNILDGTALGQAGRRWRIAGDATGTRARHVVAAMGDGCVAAVSLLSPPDEGKSHEGG